MLHGRVLISDHRLKLRVDVGGPLHGHRGAAGFVAGLGEAEVGGQFAWVCRQAKPWSAVTCHRFGLARHVAQKESGDMSPHSQGALNRWSVRVGLSAGEAMECGDMSPLWISATCRAGGKAATCRRTPKVP